MEIRHLRLVKAIVEEGSIARAIDTLHLTPSALSHQLKEAEQQLGAQLFYRINKKMVITPVGEKVLQAAYSILGELDRVSHEVRELIGGEVGEIRISTECYTSYHWLPATLRRFHADFPNVDIRLDAETAHNTLTRLLAGQIDLTITSDPLDNANLDYVELFQDELVAVVPAGHPWTQRPYVSACDFAEENLIIYSLPMNTVTVYQTLLAPAGVEPRKVTVLPLTEASLEFVKSGLGIKVMARWAVKPYLASGELQLVKVTPQGLWQTSYAARLRNKQYPAYFECFINYLRQEINL